MSNSRARYPECVSVEENKLGNDYILGDVHGCLDVLKKVYGELKSDDRLFIVGDLTDRGQDSLGVMQFILGVAAKHPNKIIVARGNHEFLTLRVAKSFESIFKKLKKLKIYDSALKGYSFDRICKTIKYFKTNEERELFAYLLTHYQQNGGKWFIDLYLSELENKKIVFDTKEEKWRYKEDSEVRSILRFMDTLPYIIHVKGKVPFNIVHADMPVTDDELADILDGNKVLTNEEKDYALWAREGYHSNRKDIPDRDIDHFADRENKTITYVGHSVVLRDGISVTRKQRKVVNLDVGACAYGQMLVVNHSGLKSRVVVSDNLRMVHSRLKIVEAHSEVAAFLKKYKKEIKPSKNKSFSFFKKKKKVLPLEEDKETLDLTSQNTKNVD